MSHNISKKKVGLIEYSKKKKKLSFGFFFFLTMQYKLRSALFPQQ